MLPQSHTSMDSSNAKMSEDKEVLRAQIESLIYGLEDAVETLKETSDTGLVST